MKLIKKHLFKLLKNQLIAGSFVLFVGTTIANFGNYLYHLLMGRMLGPANYGVLVSLISLIYIISVASLTLNTVVVRFTSIFKAKRDYARIYSLFREFSQKFLVLGIGIFALFTFGNRSIADFLKITNYKAIILISSTFLIRFLVPINNGLLRSFLNFTFLSANNVFAVVLKLGLGLILVKMGFSVLGAVSAIVVADYLTYLASFIPLRFLFKYDVLSPTSRRGVVRLFFPRRPSGREKRPKIMEVDWRGTILYTAPTFVVILGLTSLYTTDIILVKHFFESYQAGLYSALGMLGKIIFFASAAITMVMFPLVAEKHENGKRYKNIFIQALLLVGAISAGITTVYFLAPKLMVRLLYGSSYLEIAPLLGIFGVFISVYSLANVLTNFFLSIHKTKVAILPSIAAFAQASLIWFFHKTLFQVIQISIVVTTLLLFSLLLYYFGTIRQNK